MSKPLYLLFLILSFRAYCIDANPVSPEDTNKPVVKSHKFTIGASFGYGIPTEVYGATNPGFGGYSNVFFADPGVHFDINMEYHANKHFGFIIQTEGNLNKLDAEYYMIDAGGDYGVSETGNGEYFLSTILAGPLFYQNFKSGDVVEGWVTGGLMILDELPYQTIRVYNGPYGHSSQTFTYGASYSFGEGFEIGIKYKILMTKKIHLTLHMAYDQLYTSFNYIYPSSFIPIGLLNGGVGVDFRF